MQARFDGRFLSPAYQLGGTVALNMALDEPDLARQLAGLISISAPLDMQAASAAFHRPRNWLYMRYIQRTEVNRPAGPARYACGPVPCARCGNLMIS